MDTVIYTADKGYYFPEDYSVSAENGITVTRNSESQITVSGTPTADTQIQLTAPTEKTSTPPSVEPVIPASPTPAPATPVPATPTSVPSNNNSNNDSNNSSNSQASQEAATPAPTPEVMTYTVQKGDSLWKIAHENGCSLEELVILNNISADRVKLIYPGWELLIPAK